MTDTSDKKFNKTLDGHKLYRKGDSISITINPSEQYLDEINAITRIRKFHAYWCPKLVTLPASKFQFNLEMSRYGRLHYHGYGIINDPLEFGTWIAIKKYKGKLNIDIDTIDDLKKWLKYQEKDMTLFKDFCIKYPSVNNNLLTQTVKKKPAKTIKKNPLIDP